MDDWAKQLKGYWDHLRRRAIPVHIVATGSSALRVTTGSRESLAGRFERLTLSHWSASSLANVFRIPPDEAASLIVQLGSYPGAMALRAAPPKLVSLNNALLSSMHPGGPPDPEREPARFGLWLENACLEFAINQGQWVTYWREEPLEVGAVFEGSWGDWTIQIKTGGFVLCTISKGFWSSAGGIRSSDLSSPQRLGRSP